MKTVSKIVKNSLALLSGQTYKVIINLLAIAILVRYLPLKVFGDYGFVMAVCMAFSIITDMGTNQIMIREIARNHDRAQEIFSAGLILKVFLSIVSVILTLILVYSISEDQQVIYGTYICALAIAFFMLGDIFEVIFKAFERMEFNGYIKIIEETIYILGIIAVASFDLGLYGIFCTLLLTYVIRIFIGFKIVSKKFFSPRIKWDIPTIKWIFREAYPIGINKLFRKTSFRIDTILLKILRTREEVGLFHGIYRIIIVALFIPRNITDSLFPILSTHTGDALGIVFEKSFKFILILIFPIIFTAFLFGDKIVILILGAKFANAVPLMQLLVLVWGFMFFSVLCNKTLNASNHQKLAAFATSICLVLNLAMDLILIPIFGYIGAGIATFIAEIGLFIVSFSFVNIYVCKISFGNTILKPLICSLVAFFAGLVLGSGHHFHSVAIGITVYLFMLFFLKVFDDQELNIIKEMLFRIKYGFKKIAFLRAQ